MRLTRGTDAGAARARPRTQRGRPVWQTLAALVLLPLLTAAGLGGLSVVAAARSADQALRAEQLVASIERLDAVRRSVAAEVLPTMLLGALQDEDRAAVLGFAPPRRAVLRANEPAHLAQTRATTDQALDAAVSAPGTSDLPSTIAGVRAALRAVRAAADEGTQPAQEIALQYQTTAATLTAAQQQASAEAISSGLSTRSVAAVQDLNQVVQLSEMASRQLPTLFGSRVLPAPASEDAERAWVVGWGNYTELERRSDSLSTRPLRTAWTSFLDNDDVAAFSALLSRQALDPQADVIATGALPGLMARSGRRDDAVAVVLEDAVSAVQTAARADRAAAVSRQHGTFTVCAALVVLSLLNAGLVARWLTVSMRALASGAQEISLGHLVDVAPRGPRELRTAAGALSSAVAGLRRVQEQARAVVAGDLDAAVRQRPLPGPLGEVVHASVKEIVGAFQARQALQDELAHQASHDALTGLPNRAQALRDITAALHRGQRDARRTGVLFIDLDGFKAVNDGHGHAAGDELLHEVARRLATSLRAGDTVGRLGGDEFVITLEGVEDVADLVKLGQRLIDAVSRPVTVGAGRGDVKLVSVGASVGVSACVDGRTTADALLAEADTATYRAKRAGRGRVEVFDDAMRTELAERADLETALRAALVAGELSLHYQPVVGLATGDLIGYEALARWTRPGVGPVRPDVFVGVAEASSLVCDLGRWVLSEATGQAARWRAAGLAGFADGTVEPTVAVNLSGRHLADSRVVADVTDALRASGYPAQLLVVEITETVLTDAPRAAHHLQALRDLGVRVAIDDFGTGFTSIAALSTTPADILKIDRSFVASEDPGQHQLATLIARAAHTFSLDVVVEGIETAAQLARARADGCEAAQGYLFSRPLPPAAVEVLRFPLLADGASTTTSVAGDPSANSLPLPWSAS